MAELHPFFVHFPIAILIVAALFDFYGAIKNNQQHPRTAYTLQLMAGISAIFAAISGNLAETMLVAQEPLHQGVMASFQKHTSIGNAAVWIIILVAVGRTFAVLEKKEWALKGWVFPVISILLAGLILVTGLLGGALSRNILEYFRSI
ncbi:MAG: hypothetical protein HQ506_12810 [Candidatus Marinimicrobia bacterium]|nr:hypothetical protein [Candidatus Neomarinimicrobiota bacterium]